MPFNWQAGLLPGMINNMPFNWQAGLLPGTKLLDIGKTVFKKGVTTFVWEICLSEKALIEVECNLEAEDSGGKSTLLNAKEPVILHNFVNW